MASFKSLLSYLTLIAIISMPLQQISADEVPLMNQPLEQQETVEQQGTGYEQNTYVAKNQKYLLIGGFVLVAAVVTGVALAMKGSHHGSSSSSSGHFHAAR